MSSLQLRVNQATVLTDAPLKIKCCFFSLKIHKNQEKSVSFCLKCAFSCFLWKLPLFSTLVHVNHIKWRPAALILLDFVFSLLYRFRQKRIDHVTLVIVSTEDFHYQDISTSIYELYKRQNSV